MERVSTLRADTFAAALKDLSDCAKEAVRLAESTPLDELLATAALLQRRCQRLQEAIADDDPREDAPIANVKGVDPRLQDAILGAFHANEKAIVEMVVNEVRTKARVRLVQLGPDPLALLRRRLAG